jgi:omega-amidase
MRVGVFQFDVVPGQPETNLLRIGAGTRDLEVDLLVLPELCTSGYLLNHAQAAQLAIELPGAGVRPFEELAKRLGAWVIAGVIEKFDGALYNSALVVGPDGWLGKQRKLHITTLEAPLFRPGSELHPFELGSDTIGIVTCFDSWFPEATRELCRRGAQLLCQPAAFGGTQTLEIMRVRAIENHVFSVTANRIGRERNANLSVDFLGRSQIVDCDGRLLAAAGSGEQTLVAELDLPSARLKRNAMCADFEAEWRRYS